MADFATIILVALFVIGLLTHRIVPYRTHENRKRNLEDYQEEYINNKQLARRPQHQDANYASMKPRQREKFYLDMWKEQWEREVGEPFDPPVVPEVVQSTPIMALGMGHITQREALEMRQVSKPINNYHEVLMNDKGPVTFRDSDGRTYPMRMLEPPKKIPTQGISEAEVQENISRIMKLINEISYEEALPPRDNYSTYSLEQARRRAREAEEAADREVLETLERMRREQERIVEEQRRRDEDYNEWLVRQYEKSARSPTQYPYR